MMMSFRVFLILWFTTFTQSTMAAVRQIWDSKDIQIFWADPGEGSKCGTHYAKNSYSDFQKKEIAQRLEKVVRPPLQKILNWSIHRFDLRSFLPVKIILNSEYNIYCSSATANSLSYIDLKGEMIHQEFTGQVWIGADLPSDDKVVSQVTIHEIGHVFIRAIRGNIGTLSDESFADFIALITHDNDPYFVSQYPKMTQKVLDHYLPIQQAWIQSVETRKAWRDFSKYYRYENSIRMFSDGHLVSPVINSIFYRLGRRVSPEKLFHAFTSVLVETQTGRGSSMLNLLDSILGRLDLPIVERTYLNTIKAQNNWIQTLSPYSLSTEIQVEKNASKITITPSANLLQDLEDRDYQMAIINFYAQRSKNVEPLISIPFYFKFEPKPTIELRPSESGCRYQPMSCVVIPLDSILGVSVSYIDKNGNSRESRIFKLKSFLHEWDLREEKKAHVMIYGISSD